LTAIWDDSFSQAPSDDRASPEAVSEVRDRDQGQ